jgi:hypothetical protein
MLKSQGMTACCVAELAYLIGLVSMKFYLSQAPLPLHLRATQILLN